MLVADCKNIEIDEDEIVNSGYELINSDHLDDDGNDDKRIFIKLEQDNFLKELLLKEEESVFVATENEMKTPHTLIIDSGATVHITNDKYLLTNLRNDPMRIYFLNNTESTNWVGDIKLHPNLILKNVAYIQSAPLKK